MVNAVSLYPDVRFVIPSTVRVSDARLIDPMTKLQISSMYGIMSTKLVVGYDPEPSKYGYRWWILCPCCRTIDRAHNHFTAMTCARFHANMWHS